MSEVSSYFLMIRGVADGTTLPIRKRTLECLLDVQRVVAPALGDLPSFFYLSLGGVALSGPVKCARCRVINPLDDDDATDGQRLVFALQSARNQYRHPHVVAMSDVPIDRLEGLVQEISAACRITNRMDYGLLEGSVVVGLFW